MTVKGIVRNGVVELEEHHSPIPDGTEVEVLVPESEELAERKKREYIEHVKSLRSVGRKLYTTRDELHDR